MNDLADNEEPAVLENFMRGVSEIDRALDAVTKSKLLRQSHRDIADADQTAAAPNLVHDLAEIVRLDLLLHRRHHVGRAQVYFFARRRAAGDQVRAHKLAEFTPQYPLS